MIMSCVNWRLFISSPGLFLIMLTSVSFLRGENQSHECERPCVPNGKPMTCHYHFEIEKYFVRSKACYNCPFVFEDCFRPDCIAADGVRRLITVINRLLPGPPIQICDGDKIEVVVQNSMPEEAVSVHWHGINQHCTPYMDGVALITQCPILPGMFFTYFFEPDPPGTHLYHAHMGSQRGDGVYGSFVVRKPKEYEFYKDLYDFDLHEHVFTIIDWLHEPVSTRHISYHQGLGINGPDSILINGRSRYKEFVNENGEKFYTPMAKFTVTKGYRYRFRAINAGVQYCPVELIIDKHKMNVISTDGFDIEAIEADSLVSFAGERWDFIINADQEIGNYWMKFKGLQNCGEDFYSAFTVAILHYEGADDSLPTPDVTYQTIDSDGVQVNPVNVPSSDRASFTISELKSASKEPDPALGNVDIQQIFYFDFYAIDNPNYHKADLYGYNEVPVEYRVRTQQINHISMIMPSFPPLSQPEDIKPDTFCDETHNKPVENCETEYCACIHLVEFPLFKVIEILLIDEGIPYTSNHPFHLHGYTFRVIAMEKFGENTSVEKVLQKLANNEIKINLYDPVFKDTVTVPRGGLTMLRLYTDNPGYWFLHCHLDFHSENGMGVIIKVGDYPDFPPIPKNFPRCGDYLG